MSFNPTRETTGSGMTVQNHRLGQPLPRSRTGHCRPFLRRVVAALALSALLGAPAPRVRGAVLYVDVNSTNPVSPYSDWSTAATTIQDAVDAASTNDLVLVTNGVYGTGGRGFPNLTNRVEATKPLTIQSVNGPAVTVIRGYQVPGTTNGFGAARCVFLTANSLLGGFTLTNGATFMGTPDGSGGGVLCADNSAIVSNCVLIGNSAQNGGGACTGTLYNCTLTRNTATTRGGGAFCAVLNNCTLDGNSAFEGGGASGNLSVFGVSAVLNGCLIATNSALMGGGVFNSQAHNCTFLGNIAGEDAGGASGSALDNCLLMGNSARRGGGVGTGALNGSVLFGNTATDHGGGADYASLTNCTVIANSANTNGGGVYGTLFVRNTIIYHNTAGTNSNYTFALRFNHCCTTPLPTNGVGNITNEPLFMNLAGGDLHLQDNSPCINAGNNSYVVSSTDFDGNPRIAGGTVDIGAYEFPTPEFCPLVCLAPAVRPAHGRLGRLRRQRQRHPEQLAGMADVNRSHQRLVGAEAGGHLERCLGFDGDLAERGWGDVLPGTQQRSGGATAVLDDGDERGRSDRHDELRGHKRDRLGTVLLSGGCEVTSSAACSRRSERGRLGRSTVDFSEDRRDRPDMLTRLLRPRTECGCLSRSALPARRPHEPSLHGSKRSCCG